jgi:hypothetical protein
MQPGIFLVKKMGLGKSGITASCHRSYRSQICRPVRGSLSLRACHAQSKRGPCYPENHEKMTPCKCDNSCERRVSATKRRGEGVRQNMLSLRNAVKGQLAARGLASRLSRYIAIPAYILEYVCAVEIVVIYGIRTRIRRMPKLRPMTKAKRARNLHCQPLSSCPHGTGCIHRGRRGACNSPMPRRSGPSRG